MAIGKYSKHGCPDFKPGSLCTEIRPGDMTTTFSNILSRTLLASLLLASAAAHSQALPVVDLPTPGNNGEPSGGSDTLARFLEALKPGVDTSLPPSASETAAEIAHLLDSGNTSEAMERIEQRLAEESARNDPGVDVQLQFLYARALQASGQTEQAMNIYREMTGNYPELPEPWNNLAALYWRAGKLDLAEDALSMALNADPGYALAWANLGDLRLAQSARALERARALGLRGLDGRISAVQSLSSPEVQP
ncbi:tetratricopeptide repeat protein [Kerstersia gyiorum]|uniref:Tetratricopeptide repeat protein n=2 Tax=Kerstersia gyiorum TaxID=206506 RepID=A0A4Q7MY57_9BURK|nr:tetratricopeptide repeat protein [Kerstersia gyiorum]